MQVLTAPVIGALPPIGPDDANVGRGIERIPEKPVGVQLQQPLALLHVTLAPGQVLRMSGVDQIDLEPAALQDVVERQPIHPGRLQGDGRHPAVLEPIGEPMQIGRKTVKPAHGIGIPIRSDGDVVGAVADVDPRGVGMEDVEARIVGPQAAGQLASLLTIQP